MTNRYKSAPFLRGGTSQDPRAVALRMRRLHEPDFAERENTRTKLHRRLQVDKVKKARLDIRFNDLTKHTKGADKALTARITHHLSKGRDACDIAIRESILVSRAVAIIASIQGAK